WSAGWGWERCSCGSPGPGLRRLRHPDCRHCEERSDEAIHTALPHGRPPGLLRFARNDDKGIVSTEGVILPKQGRPVDLGGVDHRDWRAADIRQALKEADAGDFASTRDVAAMFRKWRRAGTRRKRELS